MFLKTSSEGLFSCPAIGSQILAEHNGSTGAVLTDYVYSGSRMIAKVASGSTQYFLSDRLSERLVLDASGNVVGRQGHLPFGEDFGESGTQEKHHFTSYERDVEAGTDYAMNRQYSQNVGRFNRPDPENSAGQAAIPKSWNRYSYALNNPVNFTDPSGLLMAEPGFGPDDCYDLFVDGIYYGTTGECGDGGWFDGGGGDPDPIEPSRVCHIAVAFRFIPQYLSWHGYITTLEGVFPDDPAEYFGSTREGTRLVATKRRHTTRMSEETLPWA